VIFEFPPSAFDNVVCEQDAILAYNSNKAICGEDGTPFLFPQKFK